jgi:hypothetical protein
MDTQCKARNKTGEPCSATLYRDGYCRWHHPDLEAERQANRVAGGKAKSNVARARKRLKRLELEDVDAALCTALVNVLNGSLEPGLATAAATVARAIHSVRSATEFERRLAELEARAEHRRGWTA